MLDFSFIAPTVLSLCPSFSFSLSLSLSPHSQVGGLVRPHCFLARHVSFNLPPLGVKHWPGVGAYKSSLPVIDVAYSSVLLCPYSPCLSIHICQETTHYTNTILQDMSRLPLSFSFSHAHTQKHM